MTGQDLAAKLRDLGFTQIKSHMTALSDAQTMEIQGRLEAYGIVGESTRESSDDDLGGLVIRKKRKKLKVEPEPAAPAKKAPAPKPAPVAEPEPVASEPTAEETAPRPAASSEPAPTAVEPAPRPVAERAPAARPEPQAAPAVQPVEAAPATPSPEESVPASAAEATAEAGAEAGAAAAPESAAAASDTTDEDDTAAIDEPEEKAVRGPAGKVVGFIDLSKIQSRPEVKRPQSRRLSSSDDVAPNVQPTMGRDRRNALQRGDHGSRGALTAGQLREREAARFLRRRPVGGRGPGGGRGGRSAGRTGPQATGSPYSGGSVEIDEPITVKKLAESLAVKVGDLLKVAGRELGFGAVHVNSLLDEDIATLLANEFEVEIEIVKKIEAEERLLSELKERRDSIEEEHLVVRPPVVCFLGHVDHGKTTLIDTIRRTTLVDSEAGGITQHIGAYQVQTESGHTLTIVDTPGHAAFTSMRARGAQAVDIAVLVVAADDGVMPQTEEAIQHARAAGTPIVVALNKIDKPESNPDKVKTELANLGLQSEDWGGETAVMEVSGLKGDGVEQLLERVFLESEVLELKCHSKGPASGVVLEAEIQKGKGKVAHLLVQDGNLVQGSVILAGKGYGKVRSIMNDRGVTIQSAGPSVPVEVTGLNELPNVGDHFHVVDNLEKAKGVAGERGHKQRLLTLTERREVTNINLFEAVAESEREIVNLVVRADVQGSVQVLGEQLAALTHDEVEVKVILSGVGEVVESDVELASTSGATVIAYHVGTNTKARKAAERMHVEVRNYSVIYEVLDYVRARMESALSPEFNEEITGHAEIRRVFPSSRFGRIAGCMVLDGTIHRDNKMRLLRDGTVVHTGAIAGLRREKDDAREVREGFECGILIRDYNDINEGDVIETFKMVELKRLLEI
jgi:translation initiation factor IF-2